MSKNVKPNFGGKFPVVRYVEYDNPNCEDDIECFVDEIYITKVVYNGPATIVFWSDDTKTVSKCAPEDEFSPETGLAICFLKKIVGSETVRNTFKNWIPESVMYEYDPDDFNTKHMITTKEVRRKLNYEI